VARDPKSIKKLLDLHTKRLQKREEQAALYGDDTPPHISIEIEDIRAEIKQLEEELGLQQGGAVDPAAGETAKSVGNITFSQITGDIYIDGNLLANPTAGGDVTGQDKQTSTVNPPPAGPTAPAQRGLPALFQPLRAHLASLRLDPVERDEIEDLLDRIAQETARGEQANADRVQRWLTTLRPLAPATFALVVQILTAPSIPPHIRQAAAQAAA
jgi:hypothetical protein